MMRPTVLAVAAALVIAAATVPAHAGSDALPISPFSVEETADFSKQIERDLAARGARVALVFRSGRHREDLPEGVRYTHGAFWVWSELELEDGTRLEGYAVHNLYHGETDRRTSYLAQDWPLNFVLGDVIGEVGVIIPSPEMQRRLWMMIQGGTDDALHQPDYSLISNPHDERYQNCNEYLMDVIGAAVWETTDRSAIKAGLSAWYEPTVLRTGFLERVFGPSVDERIRLEDHDGAIRTATFASMARFMDAHGLLSESYEIRADFLSAPANGPTG